MIDAKTASEYLIAAFQERKEKNPRYSLRAFARSLGVSSGQLSEILSGKRPLSHKLARRISTSMSLGEAESKNLLFLVSQQKHFLEIAGPNSRQLSEEEKTLMAVARKLAPNNTAEALNFESSERENDFHEMDHEIVIEVKRVIRSFQKKLKKVLETTERKPTSLFDGSSP